MDNLKRSSAEIRAEQLADVERRYGKGVREAIEDYLAMLTPDYYVWLANLYDPGEYDEDGSPKGGGFYYSNSARDTAGFLPDIESTRMVFTFLTNTGMLVGDTAEAFPERIGREIVAFTKSLQSPENGYFYHPQWGTDVTMGRLSRDLYNSEAMLSRFHESPLYDTPQGTKGTLGAPSVLASADKEQSGDIWPEHLKSIDAFRAYLDGFRAEIGTKSYPIGHTLSEQAFQLINRDKVGLESGEFDGLDADGVAKGGFAAAYRDFFNGLQLENGLWEEGTATYDAVNGLMKISNGYSRLGLTLPRAEEAMRSALSVALLEWEDAKGSRPTESVKVFNPLVCINNVLRVFKDDADTTDRLRALIAENAERLIRVTKSKVSKFKKPDGSYGYRIDRNQVKSQNCVAAVAGIDEGDVNGGNIAYNSTRRELWAVLGIDVRIFFEEDMAVFLDIVKNRRHIVK